jgi:5-methyltetrahydropteroyltriglutamate--homocysteine methyltransferase
MQSSPDRILTTHAGTLPRPLTRDEAEKYDLAGVLDRDPVPSDRHWSAVETVVRQQAEAGVDVVGDGEFWKYKDANSYAELYTNVTVRPLKDDEVEQPALQTLERRDFADYFTYMDRIGAGFRGHPRGSKTILAGPVVPPASGSAGLAKMQNAIAALKAATAKTNPQGAFFPVLTPGWLEHRIFNEHYKTAEEYLFALADGLRPQYKAVADAGLILQVDDPTIASTWNKALTAPNTIDYRKHIALRVEALNHALNGIPEERVRYHFCWGSWHGPHVYDVALRDIIAVVFQVRAQGYMIEAANARHEHEWKVWLDAKLPPGKVLLPGVIAHATPVVEHPELVADRIVRFAELVGRENIVASTDCGLGGRVHPQIVWAKLRALSEGAALATKQLWR